MKGGTVQGGLVLITIWKKQIHFNYTN